VAAKAQYENRKLGIGGFDPQACGLLRAFVVNFSHPDGLTS